jgi:5'-3' exonuclease
LAKKIYTVHIQNIIYAATGQKHFLPAVKKRKAVIFLNKQTKTNQGVNLKIKDFPDEERPVERMIKNGPRVLSDAELLAIILKTGSKKENVLDLSRRVLSLSEDGTLSGLCGVTFQELKTINGIGDSKAAQILAVYHLAKRINRDKSQKKKQNIKMK